MNRFANPARFLRLAAKLSPWTTGISLGLLALGLYFALLASPADYQQGESVRILYVHVPSAWLAMFGYATIAIASAVGLIWKHPLADLVAKSASPIGACFAFLCLVTGSLWGKPMWGTWWAWDARLTSMLILFFLYLGHMALFNAFDDHSRGARAAAILALAGSVNLPVIKFSVDWWNTLHQPASVSRIGMPQIDPAMLLPLLLMAVGYTLFFAALLLQRVQSEILAAKIRTLRLALVQASVNS
jgi:heme exporter protein C